MVHNEDKCSQVMSSILQITREVSSHPFISIALKITQPQLLFNVLLALCNDSLSYKHN